jgi:hypothetical protein
MYFSVHGSATVGRVSSVGIVTGHELEGQENESRFRRYFPLQSKPALGLT